MSTLTDSRPRSPPPRVAMVEPNSAIVSVSLSTLNEHVQPSNTNTIIMTTKSTRRGSSSSMTSLGSFNILRRSSIVSILPMNLPTLHFRRSSLPAQTTRPHVKKLSAAEKDAFYIALSVLEEKQKKSLANVSKLCDDLLVQITSKIFIMEQEMKDILQLGVKHCSHRDCTQRQLNMLSKKHERACRITDTFAEKTFIYIRRKYTQAWHDAQDSIMFGPGDPCWWPLREHLSCMFRASSGSSVSSANSTLRAAYKNMKSLARALAKAQKENDMRSDVIQCGGLVRDTPGVYRVEYVLREVLGTADVIFHDIVTAQVSVLLPEGITEEIDLR